jgi:hypothetical protein
MARKFVSPGVFTQEIDKSYLAQGVANIGAAVIGITGKGPAFAPTVVSDFNEFAAKFGDVHPSKVMPYAAKNYLKNSNTLTTVRVLGSRDGSTIATNGNTNWAFAVLDSALTASAVVVALSGITVNFTGSSSGSEFRYSFMSGATVLQAGTGSMLPSSPSYIGKIFNTDPTKATLSQYGHFLYKNFQWNGTGSTNGFGFVTASVSGAAATGVFDADYASAKTPWVQSQYFGNQVYSLFKLHAIGGGNASNTDIKVTITNIRPSNSVTITPYGTFDLVVRVFSDTDSRLSQIESYSNVTLDPTSPNYLPRVVGDQYTTWNSTTRKNTVNGTYKNQSKYIRVEMGTQNPSEDALPWGHAGYVELVPTGAGADFPATPMVSDNVDNSYNISSNTYFGIDLTADGVESRLAWTLKNGSSVDPANTYVFADDAFNMKFLSGNLVSGTYFAVYNTASVLATDPGSPSTTGLAGAAYSAAQHGFTLAFQGGFDGWDPTQADPLAASGPNTSVATVALKLAVDTLSNPDELDLNLLVIPGVIDSNVNAYARLMCNTRADCMMIMDVVNSASTESVTSVISKVNTLGADDNYAATYYPCLRYSDTANGVLVTVPPSVAVIGAFAFSDRVGQVFFAPAGLNRGGLAQFGIVDVLDRLTFQDRNDLYDARINPIATFPNEGINVFGQKTLQARPSALDRINVRRLLIYAKKTIASVAKYLLFEPNNPATWQKFLSTVNPILEKIRQDQGIERFKVVMDSTSNTPDLIDRNIMTGKIFLQPTRSAEYIDLSFIITASGVSFEE